MTQEEKKQSKMEKKLEDAYAMIDKLSAQILGSQNQDTKAMKAMKKSGLLDVVADLRETTGGSPVTVEAETTAEVLAEAAPAKKKKITKKQLKRAMKK